MPIKGVDVSVYQGTIDFGKLKATPFGGFVFAKATESTDYVDANFVENHDGAKAAGVPFGADHFFHFADNPVAQANHFLRTIDGYEGELLPMVDVESGGYSGQRLEQCITALSSFLTAVEKSLGGKRCIIYSDYGDWNGFMGGTDAFSGHPLWVAEYNNDAAPTLPNGFTDWVLWQFTSAGLVDGVGGYVDCDILNGDLGRIQR